MNSKYHGLIESVNKLSEGRVNISLNDYNSLIEEIKDLKEENHALDQYNARVSKFIDKLGIPYDTATHIIGNITVSTCANTSDQTVTFNINFKVPVEHTFN